jgi:ammonia channel protein AmtB
MDPLSIGASALTVIAATIASVNALQETVKRYKGRDKTLGRLQGGLQDLVTILNSLQAVANGEALILTLLNGPVDRCAQVCREFEDAMKIFSGKSKTGLKDWSKMEFMRGDINEFIDVLADYKSTITIGLGTITM